MVRFKGDKERADGVYGGIEPLYAEDIADTIAYVVNLPDKIQITDLTVTPLHQANFKIPIRVSSSTDSPITFKNWKFI